MKQLNRFNIVHVLPTCYFSLRYILLRQISLGLASLIKLSITVSIEQFPHTCWIVSGYYTTCTILDDRCIRANQSSDVFLLHEG